MALLLGLLGMSKYIYIYIQSHYNEPPERCDNPLQWWGLNRTKYPCLSRMAMDILLIPLILVDSINSQMLTR